MKRWSIVFLFVCLVLFPAMAHELFTSLNGGNPVVSGTIEDRAVLHNKTGALYFIYIQDGQLGAQISCDNGETFLPYTINFGMRELSGFRKIRTFMRYSYDWLCFFIAEENGTEGIYALECDENGELRLLFGSFTGDDKREPIDEYRVSYDELDGFSLAYLRAGRLYSTSVSPVDGVVASCLISVDGENVTAFRYSPIDVAGDIVFEGTYTWRDTAGMVSVTGFTTANGTVIERNTLATAVSFQSLNKTIMNPNGSRQFVLKEPEKISFRDYTAGIWGPLYSVPVPYTDWQYTILFDGSVISHLIIAAESDTFIVHEIDPAEGIIKDIQSLSGETIRKIIPYSVMGFLVLTEKGLSLFTTPEAPARPLSLERIDITSDPVTDFMFVGEPHDFRFIAVTDGFRIGVYKRVSETSSFERTAQISVVDVFPGLADPISFLSDHDIFITFIAGSTPFRMNRDFSAIDEEKGETRQLERIETGLYFTVDTPEGVYLSMIPEAR